MTVSSIARTLPQYRGHAPLLEIRASAKRMSAAQCFKVYPLRSYSGRFDLREKGTSRIWLGSALSSARSLNQEGANGTLPNGTAKALLRVEACPFVRSRGGVGALQFTAGDRPTNDGISGLWKEIG